MSSVLDQVECPQCEYKEADHEFDCRTSEECTMCRHCGRYESWNAKRGEDGVHSGWIHEISKGFGALWYRPTGRGGFTGRFLNSAQEVIEAERWLRERLDNGDVESQESYLTRWNNETKQVELVIGAFHEW